jgi:DNA polymerase-1
MKLVWDTEGNGLLDTITDMWCICTADLESGEERQFRPEEIEEGIDYLFSASTLICHNEIAYDLAVIKKLYGREYSGEVIDTLVLSRLLNPDRDGGHSLEALSKSLLGEDLKVVNEDWSVFTEHMLHRCVVDVRINKDVYYKLLEEMDT